MRVGLVLGSGGARGYAHIGVIDALRERGFDVVGISGSSMGALVGALEAAGKLDEFTTWASALTQSAVLRLLDPSLTAAGVLRAEKILATVREIIGPRTIESLPIPYTAVSTDLIAGKSVWLQRGPIDAAIRASIAIPGVIAPHLVDGRLLADGGILDPLPMAPLAAVNADLTIAVSLNASDPAPPVESPSATAELLARMRRSTTSLIDRAAASTLLDGPTARSVLTRFSNAVDSIDHVVGPEVDTEDDSQVPRLGGFEVMNRTIEISQAALMRHTLAAYPPDLLIEVPRTVCRSLEFYRADEVIEIGHELACAALDSLDLGS
ncbi:patatin-like phospholipase family protein [Mycolicibacterium aubagnense]